MQQKSISIGLFILSMLGAYLLLSMLTIFVKNSAHGDGMMSDQNLKESFSESALLVETLPKPCDSKEIEEDEVCIGVDVNHPNNTTGRIIKKGESIKESIPASDTGSNKALEGNSETSAISITNKGVDTVDFEANAATKLNETGRSNNVTGEASSNKVESPCAYITNNLDDDEVNSNDQLDISSDEKSTDDKVQYVWIDPDQSEIKKEYFEGSTNGVCIELYRDNGDHLSNPNNDVFIGFTFIMKDSSNQAEDYQFTNLPDGDYFIKLYSLGSSTMKLEKAIEEQSQAPTPSPTINATSSEVIIESENQHFLDEEDVNDHKNVEYTQDVTNIRLAPSTNTQKVNSSTSDDTTNIRLAPSTNTQKVNSSTSDDTTNIRLAPSTNTQKVNSSTSDDTTNIRLAPSTNTQKVNSARSDNTANNRLAPSNNTQNIDSASSNNPTTNNTKAEKQHETRNHTSSSNQNSNINTLSAPLNNNTNTAQDNSNDQLDTTLSSDYDSNTYYNESSQNNSASIEYQEQVEENSNNITIYATPEPTVQPVIQATAQPIVESTVEPTVEPTYENYETSTDSLSSYENQDSTNQSVEDTYETDTATYSDSESTIDTTYEESSSNDNSNNTSLSSIKIQINPSNPDASLPSATSEENQITNESEVVVEEVNTEQNEQSVTEESTNELTDDVHQFELVEPGSEATPVPAADETSSSAPSESEGGLSPSTGLGFSIGNEVGSDSTPTEENPAP